MKTYVGSVTSTEGGIYSVGEGVISSSHDTPGQSDLHEAKIEDEGKDRSSMVDVAGQVS